MKPRQPPRTARSETGANSSRSRDRGPGRCGGCPIGPRPTMARFFRIERKEDRMSVESLKCKECGTDVRAGRQLRLRKLLRPARGRLRLLAARRGRGEAADPGRFAGDLALRRLPPLRGPAERPAGAGADAAAARRPAGRAARASRPRSGSRTTPPTRPTPSRTGSSRSPSPKRRSSASRPSPAPRPATSPTPSPPTPPPPGLDSYVFVPANLEEQKLLATGVYGTNLVGVRGNYDDVNRLCTQLAETRPWAFVNVNLRPYYAEGSKTLAYETVEQLGWKLPDRVVSPIASGSLFTKLGRGFQEWLDLGLVEGEQPIFNGAQAEGCSPVATAFAEGWDVCKPQRPETIAKSLAIGDPADGPYAVEHARAHRRRHRLGHRPGDPRGDQAAGRDDRDLHRDRRRGHRRRPAQAGRTRRDRRPASASSSTSPARA